MFEFGLPRYTQCNSSYAVVLSLSIVTTGSQQPKAIEYSPGEGEHMHTETATNISCNVEGPTIYACGVNPITVDPR